MTQSAREKNLAGNARAEDRDLGQTRTDAEARKHLWHLIGDMRFGMLTSHNADGSLAARPLTTQNTGEHGGGRVLEFFVSARAHLVAEISKDPRVSVVYADPGEDCYVSISGQGQVLQDLQRQRELWSTAAQAWFAGGADDPELRLLRVNIAAAEYWDVDSNKMEQLLEMAKAAITGKPPIGMGEHRDVSM